MAMAFGDTSRAMGHGIRSICTIPVYFVEFLLPNFILQAILFSSIDENTLLLNAMVSLLSDIVHISATIFSSKTALSNPKHRSITAIVYASGFHSGPMQHCAQGGKCRSSLVAVS